MSEEKQEETKEEKQEETKEEKQEETKEEKKTEGGGDIKEQIKEVLNELGLTRQQIAPPSRRVDVESMAEQMVREASAKLEKEKQIDNEIADLKKKVEEKAEEVPKKVRKLTKVLWGEEK